LPLVVIHSPHAEGVQMLNQTETDFKQEKKKIAIVSSKGIWYFIAKNIHPINMCGSFLQKHIFTLLL